jgi:hypothetical protein
MSTTHLTSHHRHAYVVLECNTDIVAGDYATWDTYYDRAGADLAGVLPSELGLSTADGITFEAEEELVLAIHLQILRNAAPGHTGRVYLLTPDYLGLQQCYLLASGNDTLEFRATGIVPMGPGDTFSLATLGINPDVLATYAAMQIVRIG